MEALFNAFLADDAPQSTILPLFGGAEKPVEEMTTNERERAARQVYAKVREAAFSRGFPVIIKRNGQIVKEFADGHTEIIT
ncbi:hypothetical protein [Fibrella aquatilis]|uniref:Uncharacterized protein n=1 Tax=Fibrella aquatilis TaxID=2817059 RepID=A0A939JX50_9BACT|nr:hypothetical protein [Fibrella aquatilis]MBO0932587.1 hypothetical protein [Fibrella aquatilis]